MTLYDAIIAVLTKAGEPLHYGEITERILAQGLWSTSGQTPTASVIAVLSMEIKLHGEVAAFVRTAPGTYTLRTGAVTTPIVSVVKDKAEKLAAEQLSFNDAAALILEQYSNGQPMNYRAITDKALALGLIQTKGLTPSATMSAQLTTEIAKATSRAELPRFVAHGHGMYGLSNWQPTGIASEIEAHNETIRQQMREALTDMKPDAFEILIGKLMSKLDFDDVVVTKKSGDGGVDARSVLIACGGIIRTQYAVQVKRWKANVQSPDIQSLRGCLAADEHGLFVTLSDYSPGARAEAAAIGKKPITLINGKQLLGLLIEHNFGVRSTEFRVLEIGEGE